MTESVWSAHELRSEVRKSNIPQGITILHSNNFYLFTDLSKLFFSANLVNLNIVLFDSIWGCLKIKIKVLISCDYQNPNKAFIEISTRLCITCLVHNCKCFAASKLIQHQWCCTTAGIHWNVIRPFSLLQLLDCQWYFMHCTYNVHTNSHCAQSSCQNGLFKSINFRKVSNFHIHLPPRAFIEMPLLTQQRSLPFITWSPSTECCALTNSGIWKFSRPPFSPTFLVNHLHLFSLN